MFVLNLDERNKCKSWRGSTQIYFIKYGTSTYLRFGSSSSTLNFKLYLFLTIKPISALFSWEKNIRANENWVRNIEYLYYVLCQYVYGYLTLMNKNIGKQQLNHTFIHWKLNNRYVYTLKTKQYIRLYTEN